MNKRGDKRLKAINFFPKNRRGQYYIIAAIIFLGIFFSLMDVLNSSKKENSTKIEEISKEIKIESSKVIEYSSNTGDEKIEDFTKKYSEYAGKEVNIYFITGEVDASWVIINSEVYNYAEGVKENLAFTLDGNILNTNINEKTYSFDFKKGKNFYFIIVQNMGDEKYILRG
ncbi:MAG: hypothetical protein ABIH28_01445 [archaeon]